MAWFIGQSLLVIAAAFLLGILVGWLIWGRRRERPQTAKATELAVTTATSPLIEDAPTETHQAPQPSRTPDPDERAAVPEPVAAAPEPAAAPPAPVAAAPAPVAEVEPVAGEEAAAEVEPVAGEGAEAEVEPVADEVVVTDAEPVAASAEPVAVVEPVAGKAAGEVEPVAGEAAAAEVVVVAGEEVARQQGEEALAAAERAALAEAELEPEGERRQEAEAAAELEAAAEGEALVVAAGNGEPEPSDDLERIEGIGPAMSGALTLAGIRTYQQLAGADQETLRRAIEARGLKFAPSLVTWAQQAQLLADGDEEGFADLTRRLVAGRDEGRR